MAKDHAADKICPLCERRLIEHTSGEKKDCKDTLELLEKISGNPVRGSVQDRIENFE